MFTNDHRVLSQCNTRLRLLYLLISSLQHIKRIFVWQVILKLLLYLTAQYWPLCFAILCCCFGFYRSEASIVIKEFYSGSKQKPQNFQHHKKWPPRDRSVQCSMGNTESLMVKLNHIDNYDNKSDSKSLL